MLIQYVDEAITMYREWHPSTSPDFCVTGVKLVSDGGIDGCTAALSRPYDGQSGLVAPVWPAEAMDAVVSRAAAAGLQCAIHAIGDVAVTQAINSIAKTDTPGARHRIEHLQIATEEDAKRLGQLGIVASIQPVHSDPEICGGYTRLIGPRLWERTFPYREFADGHARLAIGTDAPTASHMPLPNLYNATTRRSALNPSSTARTQPRNALTLSQSIVAATAGAAYSRFAETWVGSLKRGLQADFVLIDAHWTPETLLQGRVVQTWAKGIKIFDADIQPAW